MGRLLDALIEGWREAAGLSPDLFPGDAEALTAERCSGRVSTATGFDAYRKSPDFRVRHSKRLQLGLIPQPFHGDLANACVFILMANPGLTAADFYLEEREPEVRRALRHNLCQKPSETWPFPFLDNRLAYHPGYRYWRRGLTGLAQALGAERSNEAPNLDDVYDDVADPADAWPLIRRRVAVLQLVPYHSTAFTFPSCFARLPSVQSVRRYVSEELLPRASTGEIRLVVARAKREWLSSTTVAEAPGLVAIEGRSLPGQLSVKKTATRRIASFLAKSSV